ncbi:MAG: hypothetical protein WC878_03500 [Candidatus Paceibacterota bacterium]|jgi:hypothetical protein
MENINLTRGEKILFFLYEYGKGEKKHVRYEDIVVGLFKKYPQDFHLKGYTEYPDSGDLIHKPLYDFKKKGLITASNKIFSLTERGIDFAQKLGGKSAVTEVSENNRLSRSASMEVSRIESLEGFIIYCNGNFQKISDNDFYNYLGVSVRTQKNQFLGRLETMSAVIGEIKQILDNKKYANIIGYHELLNAKYKNIIKYFTNK